MMQTLTQKQKQLMAEFWSNTAVVIIGVGVINPLFFPQKDVIQIIKQVAVSLIIAVILLAIGSYFLKK